MYHWYNSESMSQKLIEEIERTKEKINNLTPGSQAHTMYSEVMEELTKRLPEKMRPRKRISISDSICESCEG